MSYRILVPRCLVACSTATPDRDSSSAAALPLEQAGLYLVGLYYKSESLPFRWAPIDPGSFPCRGAVFPSCVGRTVEVPGGSTAGWLAGVQEEK